MSENEEPILDAPLTQLARRRLLALGAAGLVVCAATARITLDGATLRLSREDAVSLALNALKKRGFEPDRSWEIFASVMGADREAARFIWETRSRDLFRSIHASSLSSPVWQVRVARFQGDVAARAEEYKLWVGQGNDPYDGPRIQRLAHGLPEDQPGRPLEPDEAREAVLRAARVAFGVDPLLLKSATTESQREPHRLDYLVEFSEGLPEGLEGRIFAHVAGDEVADLNRYVHVPEDWERMDRRRASLLSLRGFVGEIAWQLLVLAGLAMAAFRWAGRRLPRATLGYVAATLFGLGLLGAINGLPAARSSYATADSLAAQDLRTMGSALLGTAFLSLTWGLFAALGHGLVQGRPIGSWRRGAALGLALGFFIAPLTDLGTIMSQGALPAWPVLAGADAMFPILGTVVTALMEYALFTVTVLLLITLLSRARRRAGGDHLVAVALALGIALVLAAGDEGLKTLGAFVAQTLGVAFALVLAERLLLSIHPSALPIAVAVPSVLKSLGLAVTAPFAGARPGAMLSIIALAGASAVLFQWLEHAVAWKPRLKSRLGSQSMLEVTDLVKSYGAVRAVDGLTFEVRPGEIVGLLGPNGAGKTTTMRMIVGILRAEAGSIFVAGLDVEQDDRQAKQLMAFIPEVPSPYEMLTVREQIQFVAMCFGTVSEFDRKISGLLARLDLQEKENALVATLSKGMRQKLAVACALVHDARLFVCDEPLMGIDPRGQNEIKEELRCLRDEGRSVLVSTHQLDTAERLCDRLIIMHRGRCLAQGTLDELRTTAAASNETLEEVFLRLTAEGRQAEDVS